MVSQPATHSLAQALDSAQDLLEQLATASNLGQILEQSFGDNYSAEVAQRLQADWLARNVTDLPEITILPAVQLNQSLGAYAASTDTIYLSQDLIDTASPAVLLAVLLEEIGHSIDARINTTDASGDEGAIFAALVQGQSLSDEQLATLRAEDDQSQLLLDGQVIEVERATDHLVNLSVSTNTGVEVETTAITVTATSNTAVIGNQTVTVDLTGTNINLGSDFFIDDDDPGTPGIQIEILDGQTSGDVTLTIIDDDTFESEETATITLANPSTGLTLGSNITTNITITDDETVSLGLQASPVDEDAGTTDLTANLTGIPAGGLEIDISFVLETVDDLAVGGEDYIGGLFNLSFPAASTFSDTSLSETITIIDDNIFEGNESFSAHIMSSTSGVNITMPYATVEIVDNDNSPPTVAAPIVVNASETDANFSVNLLDGATDPDAGTTLNISNLTIDPAILGNFDFTAGETDSTDTQTSTVASAFTSQASGSFSAEFGTVSLEDIDGISGGATSQAFGWSGRSERDANNSFFEFTITPGAGASPFDFDTLTFDAKVLQTIGGTTAFDYNLFWSVDGFGTPIDTVSGPSVSGGGVQQSAFTPVQFDLSALSSQTSAVTFRLDPVLASGSSSNGATSQRRGSIDNIALTASIDPPGVTVNGNSLDVDPSAFSSLSDGESATLRYNYDIIDGDGGTVAQTATLNIAGVTPTSLIVDTLVDENDGDFSAGDLSLREAIEAIADGGTITFAAELANGTISLGGSELAIDKNIEIDGDIDGDDTADITIDANAASRIFNINDGNNDLDKDVILNGLIITNGDVISGNPTGSRGGGLYNRENLTITHTTISGNSARDAGGFFNRGTATVSNSVISNNTATSDFGGGGGIENSYDATLFLSNSTVSGNTATGSRSDGGGIMSGGISHFSHITVSNNNAANGAGIYIDGSATISNSTISGNTASDQGGGIYHDNAPVTVSNSTIANNSAPDAGGGGIFIDAFNDAFTLENSIIANNTGGDVRGDRIVLTNSINLVRDGSVNGALTLDPALGALQNNGGVTETHALLAGSPAIDLGDSGSIPADAFDLDNDLDIAEPVPFDQRGNGFDRVVNSAVDLGAVEFQGSGSASFSLPALASTLTVDTLVDENDFDLSPGDVSLREAIAFVEDGGLIDFAPGLTGGTIHLNAAVIINKSLTIQGLGAEQLTLDAGGNDRIFTINDQDTSTTQTVSISELTLTNGQASNNGGAIHNREDLTISNSVLSNHSAEEGGAIYSDGTLTINNSTISGSSATDDGGAILSDEGTLTINNSVLTGNTADDTGGAIYGDDGDILITNSTFSGNTAGDGGGAIYNDDDNLTIINSTISGNFAKDGGGIESLADDLTVIGSTIINNFASEQGGGIFTRTTVTGDDAIISNSTISGNTADESGGGIHNETGLLQIRNSTITDNTAVEGMGSGVSSRALGTTGYSGTRVDIVSSIIAGNTNSDVDFVGGDGINNFISEGTNLIGTGNALGSFTEPGDTTGVTDPGLAALADNGGPTQTHALQDMSPALDAGSNPDSLTTDQRGTGFTRIFGAALDIGAFELINFPPTALGLSNNAVTENVSVGTTIGQFFTTDPEAADTHTYTLVSGTGDTDNSAFSIMGATLQTGSAIDFETQSSYNIRVETADSSGNTLEQSFVLSVIDVNEANTQSGSITVMGTSGRDRLTGDDATNDELLGGDGIDLLRGLGGNDTLVGGLGGDRLLGGPGADVFRYDALNESLVSAADAILDFTQPDGDRLSVPVMVSGASHGGDLSGQTTLTNAITTAAGDLDMNEAIFFGYRGRTYIIVDGGNGIFDAASDLLIQASRFTFAAGDGGAGAITASDYFV